MFEEFFVSNGVDEICKLSVRLACRGSARSFRAVTFLGFAVVVASGAFSFAYAQGSQPAAQSSSSLLSEETPNNSAAQQSVVRWTGILPEAAGRTVEMQFAIYANQRGGFALWNELQSVKVGADGHYSVLLGAATSDGLPQALFPSGEPRWVEARPQANAGNSDSTAPIEQPRSLIAAVPYAFKAVDAETLAGRAASDYVTQEDLKAAASAAPTLATPTSAVAIQPNLAGTGVTNYLPIWTNSTTLGNSTVYETASKVGIGLTSPATTLDVNGTTTLRGTTNLNAIGTATASAGYGSRILQFSANAWSSTNGLNVPQTFQFQALPVGNNTATPSGNISLLYGAGTNAPQATGLSFGSNGLITFAAGQKFPGTGGIAGVTATSPLTGGGTSGAITVGLNVTTLETTLNGKYPQLAAANNFTSTSNNNFAGPITANSSASNVYAIHGFTTTGYGVQGYATGAGGFGAAGYATGAAAIGVYGLVTGGANNNGFYPTAVYGRATSGIAVKGQLDTAKKGQTAILGQTGGPSAQYTAYLTDGLIAGVWGDVANSSTEVPMGVAGTVDNGYAGVFENTSNVWTTIYAYNKGTAGTGVTASLEPGGNATTAGHFDVLMAGNPNGTCGIGGGGDLSCTGQLKSLVSTRAGQRTLETYSVQSSENWMEDFGSGTLKSGSIVVRIDPDFAETITESADYRIFLTPNGDSKGLYVTKKTPTSFEVRESGGGSASIPFDYRIVAKRRGLETQRLTDVTEKFKTEMKANGLGRRQLKASE